MKYPKDSTYRMSNLTLSSTADEEIIASEVHVAYILESDL